jgi:hypothetical protein
MVRNLLEHWLKKINVHVALVTGLKHYLAIWAYAQRRILPETQLENT